MKKIVLSLGFIIALLVFTQTAFADTPVISTYTISPSMATNGQLVSVTWTSPNAGGMNVFVACVAGVKIYYQGGSVLPCDTKTSISNQASDSVGLTITNVSGSTRTLAFNLYPRDAGGVEYPSAMQTQYVSVATMAQPIDSVTASATTTMNSASTTSVSWNAPSLDGVNLVVPCVSGVDIVSSVASVVTAGKYATCGQLLSTGKLSNSNSATFSFKNNNSDHVIMTVIVVPYVSDNAYDMTHAQSVTIDAYPDKSLPPQIISFVASQPKIASGDTDTFLWATRYAYAVNFSMDCVEGVSAIFASSTNPVPCGRLLSDGSFSANSSAPVVFTNTTNQTKTVKFTIYPQLPNGGFDGINAKSLWLDVTPVGQVVLYTASTTQATTTTVVTSSTQNTTTIQTTQTGFKPRKKFTKPMQFGSRGDDVSALQEFLAHYPDVYPDALVTGYFGRGTEKAVQKFQIKYGISKSGGVGYGTVGPGTRAKLNSF